MLTRPKTKKRRRRNRAAGNIRGETGDCVPGKKEESQQGRQEMSDEQCGCGQATGRDQDAEQSTQDRDGARNEGINTFSSRQEGMERGVVRQQRRIHVEFSGPGLRIAAFERPEVIAWFRGIASQIHPRLYNLRNRFH